MNRDSGFTLLELMIAVAVLGILLALAIPSFLGLIRDSQRSSAVNDLLADMTFARSEAGRRGRDMIVCSNVSGDTCGSDNDWGAGWIVFEDSNSSATSSAAGKDTSEPVIRRASGRVASLTVTGNQAFLQFRPFNKRSIPGGTGTVTFCDPRGAAQSRAIIVASSGRPRVGNVASCP